MIESARRTLEEYIGQTVKFDEKKDKSLSNNAAICADSNVEPGTVFCFNYFRHGKHAYIEELVPKLKGKKVYSSFLFRDRFADIEYCTPIRKNSDDYFKYLYSAKYLVVDKDITPYYVPSKKQNLIVVIDDVCTKTLEDKVAWSNILAKANIVTASKGNPEELYRKAFGDLTIFSGKFLSMDEIVELISKDELVESETKSEKKQTAILASYKVPEIWMPYITNSLDHIDYDKNEVTLVIDKASISSLAFYLEPYLEKVNIISKTGWFFIREEDRKLYDFINTDLTYMKDYKNSFEYISKDIYVREFRRIVGLKKFDEIVLVGDRISTKNYWINIARALDVEKKSVFFDSIYYEGAINEAEVAEVLEEVVTRIYLDFDKVVFFADSQVKAFEAKAEKFNIEYNKDKCEVFELPEFLASSIDSELLTLDHERYAVYNEYMNEVLRMEIVPVPDGYNKNLLYIVEKDEDFNRESLTKVKEYVKGHTDTLVTVIDMYDISNGAFASLAEENENARVCIGAIYFYVLKKYADKFVVRKDSKRNGEIEDKQKVLEEL